MTMTWSTPLAFSSGSSRMYPGTWSFWHVGVNAPGTETRTTFLFLNSVFPEVRSGQ